MTTEKQLEANRENGKLGGVKTEEGKAVSRYNALKHGLLSKEVLLEWESEKDLVELGKRMRAEIKPKGEVELFLTDRIIANSWRLRRLLQVETAIMEWQSEEEAGHSWTFEKGQVHGEKKLKRELLVNEDIEHVLRYEVTIERSLYKAMHELQRLQAARAGEKPSLPVAVDVDISGKD